jgi:hypothetical protein
MPSKSHETIPLMLVRDYVGGAEHDVRVAGAADLLQEGGLQIILPHHDQADTMDGS